jgi:flagellar hook-associated protein 2
MSVAPASSTASSLAGLNPTTSSAPITISGLASGLNTNQIIQGLLAIDQQRVTDLNNQETQVTNNQTAFKQVEAQLLGLQNTLGTLSSPVNNVFAARTATPSDNTVLTAAASGSAVPGVYTLTVNSLAQAQQIASQGFASTTSAITQGTFQIGLASGQSATITIDGTNDTLQGLANAINNANVGVSASIINDGSAQPYRLLLTSSKSGTANAISINNGLAADNNGAVQPLFQTTVQQATDASVTLGDTGNGGGLTITSASNQINSLIQGVTLSLTAKSSGPISLTIAADTASAGQAVQNFVQAYNSLVTTIGQATSFDSTSGKAGPLLGDYRVTTIEDQVRSVIENTVPEVNPRVNQIGAIGITVNSDGTLSVDQTQLNNVLSGSVQGVSLSDVQSFFALAGSTNNPNVQFLTGSDQTQASATPYQVQVTQAATQAQLTAAGTLQATTTIDSSNDTFAIKVDGIQSGAITLAHNAYTPQQLAQAVQSAINNSTALAVHQVTVGLVNGNQLAITSSTYGSTSSVAVGSQTAGLDALGLTGSNPAQGQDVQGNFVVDNVVEQATGRGQILTGNFGNAHTAGLALLVTLTPAQVTNTPEAAVTVTRGIASRLADTLNGMLDPVTGRLATIDQSFQDQLTQLQQAVTEQNQLIAAKQQNLVNEFATMEQTIAQLQSTSSFLSNQFAALLSAGTQSQQQQSQKGILNG